MCRTVVIAFLLSLIASQLWAVEPPLPVGPVEKPAPDSLGSEKGAIVGLVNGIPQNGIKLEFPVERITLSNGMVFLLHSQRTIPIISFHTWFRVGAKDELPGESGLAHMFEHMMFKGTKKYPNKEFDRILQANGIVNNAFTTQDYTGYYEILPSSKLELIMDMESDRLQSLVLNDEEFQKERQVVLEERRMRYDNDPSGKGWEKLNDLVFKNSHYALPVIGTMEDINGFTVTKLERFYRKWYTPSNAVVVIAGDFDVGEIKKLINKYYGDIKSPPRPQRSAVAMVKVVGGESSKVPFPVQSAELFSGSQTIKSGTDDAYALDLLSAIFGQGKSSHLFQELVYKQQIALSAGSGHYTLQDSGMFYVQAVAKPGVDAAKIKSSVEAAFERLIKQPLKPEELAKAKNMVVSDYVESLKTTDGKAKILALNEITQGDYREFFRDLDRYLKVSIEDLQRVKSYLAVQGISHVIVDQKTKESMNAKEGDKANNNRQGKGGKQ